MCQPYQKVTIFLPENTQIIAQPGALTALDRQAAKLATPLTPLAAWRQIVAQPLPGLRLALRIRDAISARAGMARIGRFSVAPLEHPKPGDNPDFFLIENLAPDGMICITSEGALLGITAGVVAHLWFGRVYLWAVGPARRLIVWLMLRHLRRAMN